MDTAAKRSESGCALSGHRAFQLPGQMLPTPMPTMVQPRCLPRVVGCKDQPPRRLKLSAKDPDVLCRLNACVFGTDTATAVLDAVRSTPETTETTLKLACRPTLYRKSPAPALVLELIWSAMIFTFGIDALT